MRSAGELLVVELEADDAAGRAVDLVRVGGSHRSRHLVAVRHERDRERHLQ